LRMGRGVMKLKIYTEREFPEADWPQYIAAMKEIGSNISDAQYDELITTGKLVIDHRTPDGAITVFEITERGVICIP